MWEEIAFGQTHGRTEIDKLLYRFRERVLVVCSKATSIKGVDLLRTIWHITKDQVILTPEYFCVLPCKGLGI